MYQHCVFGGFLASRWGELAADLVAPERLGPWGGGLSGAKASLYQLGRDVDMAKLGSAIGARQGKRPGAGGGMTWFADTRVARQDRLDAGVRDGCLDAVKSGGYDDGRETGAEGGGGGGGGS